MTVSWPFLAAASALLLLPLRANAQSQQELDAVWLVTASAMVFLMQAGFALLESGCARSKNSVNVVMKNYCDVCIASLLYWLLGFGLMFGANPSGWLGTSGFAMTEASSWDYSFLLFQTMFAATAATITSGAMAERTRFGGYLLGAAVIITIIYPVFGSWAWGSYYAGDGWLAELGFIDFAGSSVVHSVGGWCSLAAIIVLGPRLGRFSPGGKPRDLPGHNLNLVALGGFILWFGWFGFNGGSTLGANVDLGLINLNTQLAAASGAIGAVVLARLQNNPILVTTVVNGSLAGLVGITAGCATMSPPFAVVTGLSAGALAWAAEKCLLKMCLDDVVGAVSVHAVAGAWGTICAGLFVAGDLFNINTLVIQLVGVLACFAWSFGAAFLAFKLIDLLYGLRADPLHEQRGLDFTEHAEVAYPEFNQSSFYTKQNLEGVER